MAMLNLVKTLRPLSMACQSVRAMSSGTLGSGEGRGGGGGGSIRKAGGAFGEMEVAREEEYFRKLQAQQLKALRNHIEDEMHHTEAEISRLNEELKRKQSKLARLQEDLESNKH